jgi:hypothetical protein
MTTVPRRQGVQNRVLFFFSFGLFAVQILHQLLMIMNQQNRGHKVAPDMQVARASD